MSGGASAATARFASLLGLWLVLIGLHPADVVVGIVTAAAATWVGLALLPPQADGVRGLALPRLMLRFLGQSLVAGLDVARRALDPRLPLRPGFTTFVVGLPPGPLRNAFVALTCLLPGTFAVEEEGDSVVYHCLDLDQPIAEQLAAAEASVRRSLRSARP